MRQIFVTGFGPFPGVADNASSVIVEQLANVDILDLNLEVSVEAVDIAVERYNSLMHSRRFDTRPLLIHFGVSCHANSILLERRAQNRKHFTIPDVCGVLCKDEDIMPGLPDMNTPVNIEGLIKQCESCECGVEASDDAGTYLCNYLYYKSIYTLRDIMDVLFIHVPPFEVVPESIQLLTLQDLITFIHNS